MPAVLLPDKLDDPVAFQSERPEWKIGFIEGCRPLDIAHIEGDGADAHASALGQ
jgi:hypothetical protein